MGMEDRSIKQNFKVFGGKARRQCMRAVGRSKDTFCNLDDIKT